MIVMKHVITSILTVGLVLFTFTTNAQDIKKANKEFELHAFNLAIKSYQAILSNKPDNIEALFKIAECYRHLNQIDEAINYYKKAVAYPTVEPVAYFNYGQVLMNKSDYDEAIVWFLKYAVTNPYVGSHYAENCEYAKSLQGIPALYRVKKEYLNKTSADFGAAFYNDKIVYSSSRSDLKRADGKATENWTGSTKNQLFITSTDENGYLKQPGFLRADLKNNYNEGPVTYSGDGKWVVFTKNNFVNGTRQIPTGGMELSLYIAEVIGEGDWRDPKAFSFNGNGYSSGYAYLNFDGTKLYFASNRPDGYGGYDIYTSTKTGESWSSPQNLGPVVNSPGNEITPFLENGILYFASDWHQGLGGFDLFKADYTNGNWNRIFHLGNTINSNADDYGLIFNSKKNIGYFTSSRSGGKGNEDIYQFSQLSDNIVITVKNAKDNSPIANATVDFSACGEASFSTDNNGEYSFQALPGLECEGVVFKNGFNSSSFNLSSDGRKKLQNIEIFLTREADKYLGRIINGADNSGIADVSIRATNQVDGSKLETTSNESGEYRLALMPENTYVIRYSKVGFTDTHQRISTGDGSNKSMLGTVNFMTSTTSISDTPLIAKSDNSPNSESDAGSKNNEGEAEVVKLEFGASKVVDNVESETVEEFSQKGFAVQLAAMGIDQKVNPADYTKFNELGNLYSRPEKGYKKLRVGIFESEEEAKEAQQTIAKAGFTKAFIVNEVLEDTEGLEVYFMAVDEKPETAKPENSIPETKPATKPNTATTEYMVRLAAYKNPQYFKASKVSDLGVIEQRTSGDFTVMYIAGFSTVDAAEKARKQAKDAGFSGAYLVENKDGELVKVEM
jgi:tetratricopeptide (TPR) repeat protein